MNAGELKVPSLAGSRKGSEKKDDVVVIENKQETTGEAFEKTLDALEALEKDKKKKRAKSTDKAKSKDRRHRQIIHENVVPDYYGADNYLSQANGGYYAAGYHNIQHGAEFGGFQRLESLSTSNDLSILKPPGAYEPSSYVPIGEPIIPGSITVGPDAVVEPMITLGPRPDLAVYKSALDDAANSSGVQSIKEDAPPVAAPVPAPVPIPAPPQASVLPIIETSYIKQQQGFSRYEQFSSGRFEQPYASGSYQQYSYGAQPSFGAQPSYVAQSAYGAQPSYGFDQQYAQHQVPYYPIGSMVEQNAYSQAYGSGVYAQRPAYSQVHQQGQYNSGAYDDMYPIDSSSDIIPELDEQPLMQSVVPSEPIKQEYNFDRMRGLPPGSRIVAEYIVGYVDGKSKKPEPVVEAKPLIAAPKPVSVPEPVVIAEPVVVPDPVVAPKPVAVPVPAPTFSSMRDEIISTIQ